LVAGGLYTRPVKPVNGYRTVTVNVAVATLPFESVAVTLTTVVPTANIEPETGVVVTVTDPQVSVAVGSGNVTGIEVADPFGRVATTFAIGLITGGVVSLSTFTVSVAVMKAPRLSVTRSVKLALVAAQAAPTVAET
jgi:hypothetical protein